MSDVPVTAYIGLGSNVGERGGNLAAARRELTSLGRISAESSIYETEPVGVGGPQRSYLNQAVRLETSLAARLLMDMLLEIEARLGRRRTRPGEPRTIDLDLLLYGDWRLDEPGLTVPHPRMHMRAFVLTPLLEIAPDLRIPGLGDTVRDLAAAAGSDGVRLWDGRLS